MNRQTIASYLNHYFAYCEQTPAGWDTEILTDFVDQHQEK